MMKRTQITFSDSESLALTASEQYSDQIEIDRLSKHDARFRYDPDTTNDNTLNLEVKIYVSDDSMDIAAADSEWHPMPIDGGDGVGNFDPDLVVYRRPAAAASIAKRNANIGFEISGRKLRFGLIEQTTGGDAPGDAGDITKAYLSSRD